MSEILVDPNNAGPSANLTMDAAVDVSAAANGYLDLPNSAASIHLVAGEDMQHCNFWLGVFQKGQLKPTQLFDAGPTPELFARAAGEGLSESGPIMLSDSSTAPARFFYLLPEPSDDAKSRAVWIQEIVGTLRAWAPTRLGLYLAPELIDKTLAHELLIEILKELISESAVKDYFLYPGAHGMNAMLNSALKLKTELEPEHGRIYVFH